MNKYFVKTKLTEECCSKLEEKGLVVLIGKQGCGKTSTAIHLMSKTEYTSWTKLKITEEEFLQIKPDDNTIIFIDDLFHGFLYERSLFDWWNSLFSFYSSYITNEKKVRLIITAEETVMEKACVFIEANKLKQVESFFVKASLHLRTLDEKMELLESQFELAKELKGVEMSFLGENLRSHIPCGRGLIGFPLCAFLYSFEDTKEERERAIFVDPRSYVRKLIGNEIQKDEHTGKTLFLLLLFHMHLGATRSLPASYLDHDVKNKFVEFLQKTCPEVRIEEFEPLSYANLKEKAERLENHLLIKINEMYEFRHQIYLHGIADFFFEKHFDFVVGHFPFAILRTCELLHDIHEKDVDKLLERLKKEIQNKHFFLVLSCNIFQNFAFEQKFCQMHSEKPFLDTLLNAPDKTSVFNFPIIFWARKYNLKELVKLLLNLAKTKEDKNLQLYLAMLGACCAVDENYLKCAINPQNFEDVRKSVFNFKTNDGKTILHILLSPDAPKADTHKCLRKLLEDQDRKTLLLDQSLIEKARRQLKKKG